MTWQNLVRYSAQSPSCCSQHGLHSLRLGFLGDRVAAPDLMTSSQFVNDSAFPTDENALQPGDFDAGVSLQHEALTCPVTAVATVQNVIVSGEGSYLNVYNVSSGQRLAKVNVFPSHSIHGIIVKAHDGNLNHIIIVWGASLVRTFSPDP